MTKKTKPFFKKLKTWLKQYFCQHDRIHTVAEYKEAMMTSKTICSDCLKGVPTPSHISDRLLSNFIAGRHSGKLQHIGSLRDEA